MTGEFMDSYWTKIINVHSPSQCAGRPCTIHSPSDHGMKNWKLLWRSDRRIFERICPEHGVGHPDPDMMAWIKETKPEDAGWQSIHGCCGCCGVEQWDALA